MTCDVSPESPFINLVGGEHALSGKNFQGHWTIDVDPSPIVCAPVVRKARSCHVKRAAGVVPLGTRVYSLGRYGWSDRTPHMLTACTSKESTLQLNESTLTQPCQGCGNAASILPMARDYLDALRSKVVVYDGGMGATLEQFELTATDYGGLAGKCHEALVLNRPDVIEGVHASMLEAGAEVAGDRHLPGIAPEARRVGPCRLHGRGQHQGGGNRAQSCRRASFRGRLDRSHRPIAGIGRSHPRADPLRRARRGVLRAGGGID